jgi:hypothetical protein
MSIQDVEYEVRIEPDDWLCAQRACSRIHFEGNCSAVDDEEDAKQEAWVRDQLDRGNQAAWCYVSVSAKLEGFEGRAGVGGCSYESEDAIHAQLVPELQPAALDDLRETMRDAVARGTLAGCLLAEVFGH